MTNGKHDFVKKKIIKNNATILPFISVTNVIG